MRQRSAASMVATLWALSACTARTTPAEPQPANEPTGAPAPPTVTPEQPFLDGDRLRGVLATDEAGHVFYIGALDTELNRLCDFLRADADHWSCVPAEAYGTSGGLLALDATCEQRAHVRRAGRRRYLTSAVTDPATCVRYYDAHETTTEFELAEQWWQGSSCTALVPAQAEFLREVVPLPGRVSAVAHVMVVDGVRVRVLRGDDGSTLLEGVVGEDGEDCSNPLAGDGLDCLPDYHALRKRGYVDPGCTTPAAVADEDCGPRDVVYATPDEAYAAGQEVPEGIVYTLVGGECRPTDRYAAVYEVGPPLDQAGPSIDIRPYGDVVSQLWVYGESGSAIVPAARSIVNGRFYQDSGGTCSLVLLDLDAAACAPVVSRRRTMSYADPACTLPATSWPTGTLIAVERSDAGPAPEVFPLVDVMEVGGVIDLHYEFDDQKGTCILGRGSTPHRELIPYTGPEPDWPRYHVTGL